MSLRNRAVLGLSLAVAATGSYALPASANPAGTGLVISEVYGGGGNSGATYTNDFIELYNPTSSAISVEGKSVQYRSATGTGAGHRTTALSGSVPAGGHYLIQEAAGTGGTDRPADAGRHRHDRDGRNRRPGVARRHHRGADPARRQRQPGRHHRLRRRRHHRDVLRDRQAERQPDQHHVRRAQRRPAPTPTTTPPTSPSARSRPENAGSVPPPPPENVTATIAEIQGTGATSPLAGKVATTSGVVTAAYPTGGLNGFYLQTPGAGTADASDAIFVYGGSSGFATYPQIGDHVEVTGQVSEFAGSTQLTSSSDKITVPGRDRRAGPARDRAPGHRGRARGARGRAARPHRRVHGDQHLLDQPVRRDRPGRGLEAADPADRRRRRAGQGGRRRRHRRQRRAGDHPRRRRQHQLPLRREPGHRAAVADEGEPGPRRRPGELPRPGRAGVPQQRLEVPADHPGHRRRRRHGLPSSTPAPRPRRTSAATSASRRSTC